MRHAITVATFLLLSACSAQQSASRDSAADTAGARASVATLEADARALAKMTGCTSANQCRTAPVGSRPCGGPRSYLAYCAATTDSVALFRKLDELKAAEDRYNTTSGMASTCEFRTPPVPSLDGGSCKAP